METNSLNRRTFLTRGAKSITAVGLILPLANKTKQLAAFIPGEKEKRNRTVKYRILGKTGLKVSIVGYGAMRTRDPAVIHRALDYGINYIDTAHCYMDGYNEIVVGKVLKTRRKDTFIATKVHINKVPAMMASLEASLKSLQTDYVDIIQLHNLSEVNQIKNENAMEALQKMKKEGKARFIGFTTHRNQTELLKTAIQMDFYDMILVAYNFKSSEELSTAIQEAEKTGIGIVAMKTQAGGYKKHEMRNLSPHQAALKWVLQNPGVATTIPSMVTYSQLKENVRVMNSKMGWHDRKTLHRYGKAIDKTLCRMCDECKYLCPQGVDILDVNRSLMYFEGYNDPELAFETYMKIPFTKKPDVCKNCNNCVVKCKFGLNIRQKMIQALSIFS